MIMADVKLVGSINLAKLANVGIMTVNGATASKKCVVIPIDENDIYVKVENKVAQDGRQYISRKYCLGVEVYERQETSQFGATHYMKLSTSKGFINSHTEQAVSERNNVYLGDLKPVAIPNGNQASTIEAPMAEVIPDEENDLPF